MTDLFPVPVKLVIETLGGVCPVQATGTVNGLPFYFRARHSAWTLSVADSPDGDPVGVGYDTPGWFIEQEYGDGQHDAGWMPLEEARQLIVQHAEAFARGERSGWVRYE